MSEDALRKIALQVRNWGSSRRPCRSRGRWERRSIPTRWN